MDNILSEIDKAYKKGISDPRFQLAIKDLEERIAKETKTKSKVVETQKSDVEKTPKEDNEIVIE